MNDDTRRAILEEVALVRHLRDCTRAAEAVASVNSVGSLFRHRSEGYTQTLRHLAAVKRRIEGFERQREAEWLAMFEQTPEDP